MIEISNSPSGNTPTSRGPSGAARRGAGNLSKMMFGRLGTHAVLVATAVVIPSVLGAESFGHYAAVMAVIAIVQSISSFGLPLVQVRFLSPLWRLGPREDAIVLGSTTWTLGALLSIVAGIIAAVWLSGSGDLISGPAVWLSLALLAVFRSAFESSRSMFLSLDRVGTFVSLDLARAALVLAVVPLTFRLAGIDGVFLLVPAAIALLLLATIRLLVRTFPLQPTRFRWGVLRPHVGFSASALVGVVSHMAQIQLSIYIIAIFVQRTEAGILALTLQIFTFLQGLYQGGRAALMPILAELEARARFTRVRLWGGLMMRYSAALSCIACVSWALLGAFMLAWLFPSDFAPVHHAATVILLAVAFFCCGATCNGLLYIRGRGWLAAFNCVAYLVVTIAGVALLIGRGQAVVSSVCWVYVIAAGVFFVSSYLSLGLSTKTWLPLRRTVLLLLPIVVAWPAQTYDASFVASALAATGFVAIYLIAATALRLLPFGELLEIRDVLLASRKGQAADTSQTPTQ